MFCFTSGPCYLCTPALSSFCNFFPSEHTSSFLSFWYFYALAALFFEQIALGGDVGMGEPPQIKTSVFCLTVASTLSNMTQTSLQICREERTTRSVLIRFQQDSKQKGKERKKTQNLRQLCIASVPSFLIRPVVQPSAWSQYTDGLYVKTFFQMLIFSD